MTDDPHADAQVLVHGAPLEEAHAAVIMVHGRAASADDILSLAPRIDPDGTRGFVYLAPQAAGGTWYPYRFLEPMERNEPALSSALRLLGELTSHVAAAGIPHERMVLVGFSQGACLALEFVARNARRYGGAAGLSGGLIGPDGTPRDYPGSLDGTPVFLGCSDADPHIPRERVDETAAVLGRLGADVTTRVYPDLGHTINLDELQSVSTLLRSVALPV
jgi:predicted esterase